MKLAEKKGEASKAIVQPYPYRYASDFHEPDWKRLPGY